MTETTTATRSPRARREHAAALTRDRAALVPAKPALGAAVLQANLKRAIATVSHAIDGNVGLPVLSHILLSAEEDHLRLAGTNLAIGITTAIGARVRSPGAISVPAKLFADVIGGLPNALIALDVDPHTQTVSLRCGGVEASIKGLEPDEFPSIPTFANAPTLLTLAAAACKTAITQVAFAAATKDDRPALASVCLRLRGTTATFAATDGFRLAVKTLPLDLPVADPLTLLIPARALTEVARVLDGDEPVTVRINATAAQVVFQHGPTDVLARLIDAAFPDFERIIPDDYATQVMLPKADLASAVKLAGYFARESQQIVTLTATPATDDGLGHLTLAANAAEVGSNRTTFNAVIAGNAGTIALNAAFLAEAIGACASAQVVIETQSPYSPGVIRPVNDPSLVQIVMPMTVR